MPKTVWRTHLQNKVVQHDNCRRFGQGVWISQLSTYSSQLCTLATLRYPTRIHSLLYATYHTKHITRRSSRNTTPYALRSVRYTLNDTIPVVHSIRSHHISSRRRAAPRSSALRCAVPCSSARPCIEPARMRAKCLPPQPLPSRPLARKWEVCGLLLKSDCWGSRIRWNRMPLLFMHMPVNWGQEMSCFEPTYLDELSNRTPPTSQRSRRSAAARASTSSGAPPTSRRTQSRTPANRVPSPTGT